MAEFIRKRNDRFVRSMFGRYFLFKDSYEDSGRLKEQKGAASDRDTRWGLYRKALSTVK